MRWRPKELKRRRESDASKVRSAARPNRKYAVEQEITEETEVRRRISLKSSRTARIHRLLSAQVGRNSRVRAGILRGPRLVLHPQPMK
jgi:hypothetical protein